MCKPRSRRTGPSRQDVWSQKTKIAQEMVCRASRTNYLCLPLVSDEFSTIIQWNYQFLIEHKTYTSAKSSRVLYKTEVDTMYFWTSIIKLVKKKCTKNLSFALPQSLLLFNQSKLQKIRLKKPSTGCIFTQIKTTSWPFAFYRPT